MKRCGAQSVITAQTRGKNKRSETHEPTCDCKKPHERAKRGQGYIPSHQAKGRDPDLVIRGLVTGTKGNPSIQKRAFFSLKSLEVQSGQAAWKGTEPWHCHLSGEARVPRGAYYKYRRKKTRNHFPSLLVALQPLGLKGVGKKGRGQDQARMPRP
jgi:hypothetical protein